MTQAAKLKTITQGSIFNFARSDDFQGKILGMVISARCDLAQKKQDKFLYIPLIPAKDWINNFLVPKLLDELRKSAFEDLKKLLETNKLSPNALTTFGPEECLNLIESPKERTKYTEKLAKYQTLNSTLNTGTNDKKLIAQKTLTGRIDELIANKVEGYFFIDQVIDHQVDTQLGSFVAALNEPRPIHQLTALEIASGLDHELIDASDRKYDSIIKTANEMSYVLCNLKSPYIELALQRFSNFYARIGVTNHSKSLSQNLSTEVMK